jgi:DNA-binding NarL/FixJ family response regulator
MSVGAPVEQGVEARADAIRVALADDHTLVRQSVARILGGEADLRVVGEVSRGDEVVEMVSRTKPHVLILDVSMPGLTGLQAAAEVRAAAPGARVVFLTMHDDDATVSRAIAVGADGYVLKTASHEELLQCVRAVASGGSFLSPSVARGVLRRSNERSMSSLTDRELEVLRLLAQGHRPAEIARELFVSLKTVRNHLASIYAKLDVGTAAQATAEAFRRGLVARA